MGIFIDWHTEISIGRARIILCVYVCVCVLALIWVNKKRTKSNGNNLLLTYRKLCACVRTAHIWNELESLDYSMYLCGLAEKDDSYSKKTELATGKQKWCTKMCTRVIICVEKNRRFNDTPCWEWVREREKKEKEFNENLNDHYLGGLWKSISTLKI